MTTTHTPGPWQARIGMAKWNVTTCPLEGPSGDKPRSFNICTVNTDRVQQEANARLIAAAPDLLAALDALAEWGRTYTSPRDPNSPHDLLIAAVSAIAKARGET